MPDIHLISVCETTRRKNGLKITSLPFRVLKVSSLAISQKWLLLAIENECIIMRSFKNSFHFSVFKPCCRQNILHAILELLGKWVEMDTDVEKWILPSTLCDTIFLSSPCFFFFFWDLNKKLCNYAHWIFTSYAGSMVTCAWIKRPFFKIWIYAESMEVQWERIKMVERIGSETPE